MTMTTSKKFKIIPNELIMNSLSIKFLAICLNLNLFIFTKLMKPPAVFNFHIFVNFHLTSKLSNVWQ